MVQALFVDNKGPYPKLLGAENCWTENRDARLYPGAEPAVLHPPCARWCRFAKQIAKRPNGKQVGADEGCFASALRSIRLYGGVLEHPADSLAWTEFNLLRPVKNKPGWHQASNNEWVCEIWQSAYGHLARKRTWLLYVGKQAPFELNWERKDGTHQIGRHRIGQSKKKALSGLANIHTPLALAVELIKLAEYSCQ